MDWMPLVSTAAGAVIALAGTVLADVLRRRGESERSHRSERRESYFEFVLALDTAHGLLRDVAAASDRQSDVQQEANGAIGKAGIYKAREKLLVTATPGVAQAGEVSFKKLINIRDAVRSGVRLGTAEFHDVYHDFADAIWRLRMAARSDLGSRGLTPDELHQVSWSERESCELCGTPGALRTAP